MAYQHTKKLVVSHSMLYKDNDIASFSTVMDFTDLALLCTVINLDLNIFLSQTKASSLSTTVNQQ